MLGLWVVRSVSRTGSPPDVLIHPCDRLFYGGRIRRLRDRINAIEIRLQLIDIDAGKAPRLTGNLLD